MSGIEIVLIVGAGYLITKKVKQHRQEKKLRELTAAGLTPAQHGPAQVLTVRQSAPGDEDLPLYSPPTKQNMSNLNGSGHLPSYDEVRKQGRDITEQPISVHVGHSSAPTESILGASNPRPVVKESSHDQKKSKIRRFWDSRSTKDDVDNGVQQTQPLQVR